MQTENDVPPGRLSDADLISRVKQLAARERRELAQLLAHLAELDARQLQLRLGYNSLFIYCRDALRLSEHDSYNRTAAARACYRFPAIVGLIAEAALNQVGVCLLAPHLTPENHAAVLESARGKRKVEVEEIVARLAPRPDARPFIRKYPTPSPMLTPSVAREMPVPDAPPTSAPPTPVPWTPPAAFHPSPLPLRPGAPLPWRPASTLPLAPQRYRLQLTIGSELLEKLRLAKDMLSHAVPSGDETAVLDRALTLLLADLARKKFAASEKPAGGRETADGSRHIPAEVKRTVWVRDIGRCAFMGTGGHRCEERRFLEFHHVKPYAASGEPTVENIALRCRRHNNYEAKVFFERGEPDGRGTVSEPCVSYGAGGRARTDRPAFS